MSAVIGIDPGLKGGIAVLRNSYQVAWRMPTVKVGSKTLIDLGGVHAIFTNAGPIQLVIIEDVNAGAVKGIQSAFAFGRGFGRLEGFVVGYGCPLERVASPTWTKAMGLPVGSDKAGHIARARELFPGLIRQGDQLTDGQADALLIAAYGRRLVNGGGA